VGLGQFLGRLLWLLGPRLKVVRQNLEMAFPGDDESAIRKRKDIEVNAYEHVANLFLEILMLLGPMKYFITHKTKAVGYENVKKAMDHGKGVIMLASHLGNWEIMAAKGGEQVGNVLMVTKRLKPKWLHRVIEQGRLQCGVTATYEPRTYKDILAQLKKGGTVGIVLDQYAGPPIGIRVPFFGCPVGTHSVVAVLAKRTGAAVVPVYNVMQPDGTYIVCAEPEIPWIRDENPSREIAVNTAHYSSLVEKKIYQSPEQWLWLHRRFKGDLSPLKPTEWEQFRVRRGHSD